MKTKVQLLCLSAALLAPATGTLGQTFNTLLNFDDTDGANPQSGLVASGSALYGAAYSGGTSNLGTIFAVTPAGAISNLYSFNGGTYNASSNRYVPGDGANPIGTLVLSSNLLYGVTAAGGSAGNGAVFAINTNGSNYSVLYSFPGGGNGADPEAGLILQSNVLYGTTYNGGLSGDGSVFRINIDGTDFTNIHGFTGGTNGANPQGALVISGNTLFGTTYGGGSGYGTVFQVSTAGSNFATLHKFNGSSDGAYPQAGMILSGSTLYGTASGGGDFQGAGGDGTVFSVNTNTDAFKSYELNFDIGSTPQAGLLLSGSLLYGTTYNGGTDGYGAIFQMSTTGTSVSNLYSFTDDGDGANPQAALTMSGGTFYGTTEASDAYGSGTVFSLAIPNLQPALNIGLTNGQVIVTWNNPTFLLLSAPKLTSVFTVVFGATSPYTNTFAANQQFFRLALTGPVASPTLNIALTNGLVILTWNNPAFSLQTAPAVTGIFTNVTGAASPYTNTFTNAQRFFRLQGN